MWGKGGRGVREAFFSPPLAMEMKACTVVRRGGGSGGALLCVPDFFSRGGSFLLKTLLAHSIDACGEGTFCYIAFLLIFRFFRA